MPAKPRKAKQAPAAAPAVAVPATSSKWIAAVLVYVFTVLAIDTLAAQASKWPFAWAWFRWSPSSLANLCVDIGVPASSVSWLYSGVLAQFDLFKFTFWFLVPFLFCLRRMDWGWFGASRIRRVDLVLLGVFMLLCVVAVLLVPYLPGVSEYYGAAAHRGGHRFYRFCADGLWVLSWLVGWEFLHRYVLLRAADGRWARWGWLIVPLSETLYHLQKPLLETAGMGVFSLIATAWTRARRNMLPAFLVHLAIELALVLYLVLG